MIFRAILVAVLAGPLLAGCGGGSTDEPSGAKSEVEKCVDELKETSDATGQPLGDLAQALGGSRDPEEACRKNSGGG